MPLCTPVMWEIRAIILMLLKFWLVYSDIARLVICYNLIANITTWELVKNSLKSCNRHLFEVVKCWKDDLMTSSDKTNSSQQLKDQSFCPENAPNFHQYNSLTCYWKKYIFLKSTVWYVLSQNSSIHKIGVGINIQGSKVIICINVWSFGGCFHGFYVFTLIDFIMK